jgi:hypothetical protein
VTNCTCDILATTKGPSSLQDERSVSAVPNQRQSAWELTDYLALLWILFTERTPLLQGSQKHNSGHLLLLSVGSFLLKAEGEFLEPTKASGRIQHIPSQSATYRACPGVNMGLPYCHVGESESLGLPGFFSLSQFCSMTQQPFCPKQHWVTFRDI